VFTNFLWSHNRQTLQYLARSLSSVCLLFLTESEESKGENVLLQIEYSDLTIELWSSDRLEMMHFFLDDRLRSYLFHCKVWIIDKEQTSISLIDMKLIFFYCYSYLTTIWELGSNKFVSFYLRIIYVFRFKCFENYDFENL